METKISVIVPIYNAEEYLRQCVDSIRNQSLKDIEIILVDDGSTDKSGKICDEYGILDERIRVVHQKNQGLVGARKSGLLCAKGSYVIFVDADDFVDEIAYELAIPDMKKQIDIISFGIIRYYADYYKRYDLHRFTEGIYYSNEIRKNIYPFMIWDKQSDNFGLDPSLCTKVIKKELLEAAYSRMGHYSFYYGEDSATIYPIMKNVQSISIHNKAFYNHRQRNRDVQPEYVNNEHFFDGVFQLYTFLKTEFIEDSQLLEQIEDFYIHSVLMKHKKEESRLITYLFPFDKVDKGAHIVIYGAGNVGKDYMKQLARLDYCKVELWVDNNFEKIADERISNPEKLHEIKYEKIVIAIENDSVRQNIKENLLGFGVLEQDIIW